MINGTVSWLLGLGSSSDHVIILAVRCRSWIVGVSVVDSKILSSVQYIFGLLIQHAEQANPKISIKTGQKIYAQWAVLLYENEKKGTSSFLYPPIV